jgi:amidophosphoribosyltransferase
MSSYLDLDFDKLQEECGVFGVYNVNHASYECFLGLYNLQHRGQEACGIVSCNEITDSNGSIIKREVHEVAGLGEVSEVFIKNRVGNSDGTKFDISLPGKIAIGHVRYSTSGKKNDKNTQPICGKFSDGKDLVIAHNGNLVDLDKLRDELRSKNVNFKTTMDTEVVMHLILLSEKTGIIEKIRDALSHVRGAYSLIIMYDGMMIGVRDPNGMRPLVLGEIKNDNSYFLSSETCALDIVGASYLKSVEPGHIAVIKDGHYTIFRLFDAIAPRKFCIFEYVYLLRPDSFEDNKSVYEVRKRMGAELAIESSVEADVVISVPDSGTPAAIGYADKSGIKFEMGITRNNYIGRTFLKPSDEKRNSDLHIKHNANRSVIEGKKVIVVDDSIVRGNTSRKIVKMLRQAGAKEVHMRIACPEIKFGCLYGIDTPNNDELISNSKGNIEKICEYLGLDSLAFLSLRGLYKAVTYANDVKEESIDDMGFCNACFTGKYPV